MLFQRTTWRVKLYREGRGIRGRNSFWFWPGFTLGGARTRGAIRILPICIHVYFHVHLLVLVPQIQFPKPQSRPCGFRLSILCVRGLNFFPRAETRNLRCV